jgi:hypothetical protein
MYTKPPETPPLPDDTIFSSATYEVVGVLDNLICLIREEFASELSSSMSLSDRIEPLVNQVKRLLSNLNCLNAQDCKQLIDALNAVFELDAVTQESKLISKYELTPLRLLHDGLRTRLSQLEKEAASPEKNKDLEEGSADSNLEWRLYYSTIRPALVELKLFDHILNQPYDKGFTPECSADLTDDERKFLHTVQEYFNRMSSEKKSEAESLEEKRSREKNLPLGPALFYDAAVFIVLIIGLQEALFFPFGYNQTNDLLKDRFHVSPSLSVGVSLFLNCVNTFVDVLSVAGEASYQSILLALKGLRSDYTEGRWKELSLKLLALLPFIYSNAILSTTNLSVLKWTGVEEKKDKFAAVIGILGAGTLYYTLWQMRRFSSVISSLINADTKKIFSGEYARTVFRVDVNYTLVNLFLRALTASEIALKQIPILASESVAEANAGPAGVTTGVVALSRFKTDYSFVYGDDSAEHKLFSQLLESELIPRERQASFFAQVADLSQLNFMSKLPSDQLRELLINRLFLRCLPKSVLLYCAIEFAKGGEFDGFVDFMAISSAFVLFAFFVMSEARFFESKEQLDAVKQLLALLDKQLIPNKDKALHWLFQSYGPEGFPLNPLCPKNLARLRMVQRELMFTFLIWGLLSLIIDNPIFSFILTQLIVFEDLLVEAPFCADNIAASLRGWGDFENSRWGSGVNQLYTEASTISSNCYAQMFSPVGSGEEQVSLLQAEGGGSKQKGPAECDPVNRNTSGGSALSGL